MLQANIVLKDGSITEPDGTARFLGESQHIEQDIEVVVEDIKMAVISGNKFIGVKVGGMVYRYSSDKFHNGKEK